MAYKTPTSVQQYASGSGTGPFTLGNATSAKFQRMQDAAPSAIGDGDTCYARMQQVNDDSKWQVVLLTYTLSTNSIAVTFDANSSNYAGTTSPISFTSDTNNVVISAVMPGISGGSINAKWFGARGDGSTNDAAAITAAFASASALGVGVFLPAGIYKIGSQVTLSGAGLFGEPGTVTRAGTAGFNIFKLSGPGVRVRGIIFQGAAVDSTTSQFAIETDASVVPSDFEISGCRFGGPTAGTSLNCGIYLSGYGESNFRIFGNHFENLIGTTSGHGYGLVMGAVRKGIVTKNTFQGTRGTHGRHAVYVSAGAQQIVVSNNSVDSFNLEAFSVWATGAQPANKSILVEGNTINACGADAATDGSIWVGGVGEAVIVRGNTITNSYGSGIVMDNNANAASFTELAIDDNTVIDSNYHGILTMGPVDQKIRNNNIKGSSRKTALQYEDIHLGPTGTGALSNTPTHSLITGNDAIGVAGVSRSPFSNGLTGALVKCYGNNFPSANFSSGPQYNGLTNTVWIDGRLQYVQAYNPPNIADKASFTLGGIAVLGAEQGDVVSVGFATEHDGFVLMGQVYATGYVEVIFANLSGGTVDLASGNLRIDVWKRDGSGL